MNPPPPNPPVRGRDLLNRISVALARALVNSPRTRLQLRTGLHRVVCFLLRCRSRRNPPPSKSGLTLVIAPHPDDAELGCGALIAHRRANGHRIHILYLTDGSASHHGHPHLTRAQLTLIRRDEALAAAAVLGVPARSTTFMNAKDGSLAKLTESAADQLVAELKTSISVLQPGELLVTYRRDQSSEHEAAFKLVARALGELQCPARLLEYPVWSWWNPLLLLRPLFSSRRIWRTTVGDRALLKRNAIAQHRSQTEATAPWTEPLLAGSFVDFFCGPDEFLFEH